MSRRRDAAAWVWPGPERELKSGPGLLVGGTSQQTATFPAGKKELQFVSNETRSYRDEIPNPACPVHRQHCRHQRYAAPSPAPLSYCLPWQRSPSQQSCTSHDQDDQQLRRVPQPRGSASAPIPGDGSCRPFPTQVCCLAHTHTAVRVCGVHHGPAASCPSPGCNLRHGTAAQPSPSTRVEPAHECDGGAETACTGQGMGCPCCEHGVGECSRMCSDPSTSQPGSWRLLWFPWDR